RALRRRRLRVALHRGAGPAQGSGFALPRARRAAHAHRGPARRRAAHGDPGCGGKADEIPRRLRPLPALMVVFRPTPGFVYSHPAHLVAFGFGAGLAAYAPCTFGSLAAWAFGLLLGATHPAILFSTVVLLFILGVWACGLTGQHLGAHDHGAMVWDEFVAFLLVSAILPRELGWQVA